MSTLIPYDHKEFFRRQLEWHLGVGRKLALMFEKEKQDAESRAEGKTREEDPQVFEWIERYEKLLRLNSESDERVKAELEKLG